MSTSTKPGAPDTLGRRLDVLGRRLAGRHDLGFAWATPFGVLLDHLGELPSPAGSKFHRRDAAAERPAIPQVSAGRALPSDVTARLRGIVGGGVDAVRVHDDDAADARARAHRADAVTVGSDVYFRAGKLRPREPRGFALLAHEATHVVERMRPGASWRRSTAGGAGQEERLALAREGQALAPKSLWSPACAPSPVPGVATGPIPTVHTGHTRHAEYERPAGHPAVAPPASAAPAPIPAPAAATAGHPAARPMTAATDRTVPMPAGATVDLNALKALLLRDLIGQLRDEFERGG
jgi:hypothetical protein